MAESTQKSVNVPAPGIPYFTPAQIPPAGTAVDPQPDGKPIPKLFQPFKIRGVEFQNRIWLSPLCQYSADNGVPTAWHMAHLGGIIKRGPSLSFVEASAVSPEGRITPEDAGIWNDEQAAAWAPIVTFAHSQNQKIGIQLAHAGRKASMVAPWLSLGEIATEERGGWPDAVLAPSAVGHGPGYCQPKELTTEGIQKLKQAFVDAARRAVQVGFDVVELHSAHGYLLHEFLSPIANKRTDEYGGSWENRTRLHVELVDAVRAVLPKDMPLFMRISGSDLLENSLPNEPSWKVEDTIRLATLLADHGLDLIDISSGGIHALQEIPLVPKGTVPPAFSVIEGHSTSAAYQAYLAAQVRKGVEGKVLVSAVGGIRSGAIATEVLDSGSADVVFVGRHFLKNPGAVWQFAEELGVTISQAVQIEWGFLGRGVGRNRQKQA